MIKLLDGLILFIENAGVIGVILSSLLIFVESIFPALPLLVFITIEYMILGKFWGFIISYIFTVLGCIMSYFIFKKGFGNKFEKLTENKKLLSKYKNLFKNISLVKLILIVSLPFTPAFIINIAAGLTKMDFKKFLISIIIGKVTLVIYEAYLGLNAVESINNPILLLKIVGVIVIVYLVYLLIKRIFGLE